VKVMRSTIEGPSSGSNSSFALVLENPFEQTIDHTYQGDDVIEKVRLADSHTEPHRMVSIHNVNMELIWTALVSREWLQVAKLWGVQYEGW
jgi:hypothetical protein